MERLFMLYLEFSFGKFEITILSEFPFVASRESIIHTRPLLPLYKPHCLVIICTSNRSSFAIRKPKRERSSLCVNPLNFLVKMASSEEGQVISCHSLEEWKRRFQEGAESKKLVVVDFTASWCGPCRLISPVLAEIAKKMPNVIFLKVDVDELKEVAEECEVEAMPTFVFFKEGKPVDKFLGAHKDQLHQTILKHAANVEAASVSV